MTEKKHACPSFPHFLHGADYNPEQWLPDKTVWDADMELSLAEPTTDMCTGERTENAPWSPTASGYL